MGMKQHRKPISAAAALSLTAGIALLIYTYRATIVEWLFFAATARLAWGWLKTKAGIRRRPGRGKSLWEVVAALLGGYLVGRRGKDAVAHAISSGAEVQIRVPAKPSRYRAP